MRDLTWGFFLTIALIFSAIAVLANSDLGLAIPCAAIAVAAAALLLLDLAQRTRWPILLPPLSSVGDPAGVRSALRAGARGRFTLIMLLETLGRRAEGLNARGLSLEEVHRLEALPPAEFREYLVTRIRELEQRT
jgi:hypothetical protein